MEFSGELFYPGGISSSFYCSFLTEHQQWANISGTKGNLQLNDFVLPYFGNEVAFDVSNSVFDFVGCNFNTERHVRRVAVSEYAGSHATAQETNLYRNFADLVLSGQPDRKWGQIALNTQKVMEACWASAQADSKPVEFG